MGWFITIILDDNLAMIELFKTFRIGVAWINDETGKASSLILGLWKLETNLTLAVRSKLGWHEAGQA
tara:strand:- start:8781 stop:8981 length:201 start_codon:yes stop_codon:yes gene_type:complete